MLPWGEVGVIGKGWGVGDIGAALAHNGRVYMARCHILLMAAVLAVSTGLLACTVPPSGESVAPGDDGSAPTAPPAAAVQQGVVSAPTRSTIAVAPTPFIGQPGDEVSVSGTLHVLFGDPVPDPATGRSGPGFTRFYLAPDDPRFPQLLLIVDGPEPLLSQALTSSTPVRVRVTGTLLDPIPPPAGLQTVRVHVTSLTPA